jgi:hypothetical protein
MDRAFSSGASGTPPSAPVSPSTGYATSGNPGTATPATKPGAWWYHMVTEELRKLIVDAGLTPDFTNTSQVSQAVQALIAAGAANDYKASVRAATVGANITLAGGAPNTLDGVTLVANDRILVKDQTTASQNGIYYVATLGTGANGTWTRATDADQAGELTSGAIVAVEEGSTNADSQWMLTTDGTITIGTTSLTFAIRGTSTVKQIQAITASVAANALTIGASNLSLDFRSTTLTSGGISSVSGTPSNLVVPSTATLGTVSGVQSDLYVLALNNAGAIELAVVNASGGNDLSETGLISTTAISAAATAANVVYSNTARTSVAYRVIGLIRSTQATAGTWAAAPALVQGAGGNALDAMMSLGYGQTWQNVTGSRALGTTYYNTTGRPISISAHVTLAAAGSASLFVNGLQASYVSTTTGVAGQLTLTGVVPPGGSYVANNVSGASLTTWTELR